MYIFTLRTIALLTVLITMAFSPHTQAAESMSELVNRSGMQRMLSQRIAKAYFYHGNDVSVKETKLQL
ncbi:Type IV pili methyl-accepting chemotaxis transducer N-term, partial [Candidatus Electrothrix communis]